MQSMISIKSQETLEALGKQLQTIRLERNERQADFAARLGVSIPTLRKLEKGDPYVSVGTWIDAIWLLGRLDRVNKILEPTESLFERWESQKKSHIRKRASKK